MDRMGRLLLPQARSQWRATGSCSSCAVCSAADTARRYSTKSARRVAWKDVSEQKAFLERIAEDLGLKQLSDWYQVSRKDIISRGGRGLLSQYPSLAAALQALYPEFPWQASLFAGYGRMPLGYWQDTANLLNALEKSEGKLGIQHPEDWYSVALSDLAELGFPPRFSRMQLVQLLGAKYPNHKWEKMYLLRGKYAQQTRLENTVASLFPGMDIRTNARTEVGLIHPRTGEPLEVDIWIPSLSLGFEYQELHHYANAQYSYQPVEVTAERDAVKRALAKERGITLITVPCWWDGRQESLIATIRKARNDLLPNAMSTKSEAIPEKPPAGFFEKQTNVVADIGEPTTACFLTRTKTDPTGWWLFEKYDGVRGFWNPEKKAFYSRQGRPFIVPQYITDSMPDDIFLDGELWFGRDSFQEALKLSTRSDTAEIDWENFKYVVFDAPKHNGTYQERYSYTVEQLVQRQLKYVHIAEHEVCTGMPHLEKYFQNTIDLGGEGIILRDPAAPYQPGRCPGYLKHKKYRDAEARIVRLVGPSQWECELPDGTHFTAVPGTAEFAKKWNPKAGDIVSFKHRGFLLASKKPKLPVLYRLRPELRWQDLVKNWKDHTPKKATVPPLRRTDGDWKPRQFWANINNRRQFFIDFANEHRFDYRNTEHWQQIKRSQILGTKGGIAILTKYRNLPKALSRVFPELNFSTPRGKDKLLKAQQTCRQFFDDYAQRKGFDPLVPENWHYLRLSDVCAEKGGRNITEANGGLRAALHKAYPDMAFTRWSSFTSKLGRPKKWEGQDCRVFFDEVAREEGFDPLDPEHWYALDLVKMQQKTGGGTIRAKHGGFKKALQQAYPEITFSKWIRE